MTNRQRFDVLIPAHGESVTQLDQLLHAIFRQDSPTFQLHTVFLCSDNETLLERYAHRCSVTTMKQNPHMGKPHALNLMLHESTVDLCIQNSADCLPASHLTYNFLLSPLADRSVGAVTSRPEPFNMGFMFLPNIVWKCHHFVQPKLNAELFSFKKALVPTLPENVVHDDAYIHSLIEAQGYRVLYEPRAIVHNAVPASLSELYRQRKKNVVGNMQLGNQFNVSPPGGMRMRSLVLMALELLANVHGRLDYVRGKIPHGLVGYNVPSTKEVSL